MKYSGGHANASQYDGRSLTMAPESTRSLKGSASPPERGSTMAKVRVNGIEIDYEVSGHGRPVLLEP